MKVQSSLAAVVRLFRNAQPGGFEPLGVALPDGRHLQVRALGADDLGRLMALYDALDDLLLPWQVETIERTRDKGLAVTVPPLDGKEVRPVAPVAPV